MGTIEKRIQETDLTNLTEPEMSELDWEDFQKGIVLFNDGQYWESHEAWEEVWRRHEENSRIFFQGLIQVAAGLHQLKRGIHHGVDKHLRNALWKLEPFPPSFLGVDVDDLVQRVERILKAIEHLGKDRLQEFDEILIPKIVTKTGS